MAKKKKNTFDKFKLKSGAFLIGIISIALLSFSATYAFLTSKDQKKNEFSPAENTTTITEELSCPRQLMPGSICKKTPNITNTGNVDVYVRVRLLFNSKEAEDQCESLDVSSDFEYRDGWYYYKNKLSVGNETGNIIDEVKIKDSVSESDIIDFELIVYSESVNADNFNNYSDAFGL